MAPRLSIRPKKGVRLNLMLAREAISEVAELQLPVGVAFRRLILQGDFSPLG